MVEVEQKEFRSDYGDAFYDMLWLLNKKDSGLPKKIGDDEINGNTLVMHFKISSDAKKYADVLTQYQFERASVADKNDLDAEDEVLSKIKSIDVKDKDVLVTFDSKVFEQEKEISEKSEDSDDIVESLVENLFN